jgi:hypothetical protein
MGGFAILLLLWRVKPFLPAPWRAGLYFAGSPWLLYAAVRSATESDVLLGFEDIVAAEKSYLAERRRLSEPSLPKGAAARPLGLALSGGGIRSATFNLGVLQALASFKVLPKIDYLSTVSGGGYIGSCLSSLLSRREGAGPCDEEQAYLIDPSQGQVPRFGTAREHFPFNTEADGPGEPHSGAKQLRHLRTHGDFIVARKQILSRDVLRAVGNVLGGLFYHLLVFALFMVAFSGVYLALVSWVAGDVPAQLPRFTFKDYVAALVEPASRGAIGAAVAVGALIGLVGLSAVGLALRWMPDRRFYRDGLSVEDQREMGALWCQFWITLIAAAGVTAWFLGQHSPRIAYLMLPFGVYLGGQAAAVFLHAVVSMAPGATRNDRSRFAAAKGILNYLAVASCVAVLLPWLIYWLAQPGLELRLGSAWAASFGGTWLLARRGRSKDDGGTPHWGLIQKLLGLSAAVRQALLSVFVGVLLLGGVVLISSLMVRLAGPTNLAEVAALLGVIALGLFVVLGILLDFNKLSLHYFYRDRLVETYLQTYAPPGSGEQSAIEVALRDDAEMPLTHLHGCKLGADRKPLPDCVTAAPLHLVVTSLNLTASRDMTRRDRKSDHFIFSKLHCGSETTGYMPTSKYRNGETRLARALTISGAAASSAMGAQTFFAEAFGLTLFNARLGQWIENPRYKAGKYSKNNERGVFWPLYLLREMLGSTDAARRLVHVSDGGHTGDNLGIVPLLRRRCAVIVACDAEADPTYGFGSLSEALRQVFIDENIKVDLVVDDVRPDLLSGLSRRHFAVGRVRYPPTAANPQAEEGWLFVLKSSLTGDELVRIANYKHEHPLFPQEPTADQFFDDDQFESYRELGYHVGKCALADLSDNAWRPELGPDWTACWAALAQPCGTAK